MCLYPTLIRNPKYKSTKKNGGNIPPIKDIRVTYVPIGCNNCIECRKQKANSWQTRLLEDIKTNTTGKFVTLTFNDESINQLSEISRESGYHLDNDIATIAIRRFLERWRKKYKRSLRHWLVTELGGNGTENVHLHGIIWTDKPEEIQDIWQYGYTWLGNYVNERTIRYIVKYVTKMDIKHPNYKALILTSAGIGNNYRPSQNEIKNEAYRTSTGHKVNMPIYWRNKIYSEEQREQLWIDKLNKERRWIMGIKIDISKTEKNYINKLESARRNNKELGYGTNEKNWEEEQYEINKRVIKQETRIQKARSKINKTKIKNNFKTPRRRGSNQKG